MRAFDVYSVAMGYTREERKALQEAVHIARLAGRITDRRCTELVALVERESEDAKAAARTPLEVSPGIWDLHMKDGSTVRAQVGVAPGIGPWWSALDAKPGDIWSQGDDWTMVNGAVQVSRDLTAGERSVQALGYGPPWDRHKLGFRPDGTHPDHYVIDQVSPVGELVHGADRVVAQFHDGNVYLVEETWNEYPHRNPSGPGEWEESASAQSVMLRCDAALRLADIVCERRGRAVVNVKTSGRVVRYDASGSKLPADHADSLNKQLREDADNLRKVAQDYLVEDGQVIKRSTIPPADPVEFKVELPTGPAKVASVTLAPEEAITGNVAMINRLCQRTASAPATAHTVEALLKVGLAIERWCKADKHNDRARFSGDATERRESAAALADAADALRRLVTP